MTRRLPLLLLSFPVAAGCGDAPEDHPSTVRGLRVLAVSVDPPEAAPGATVTLDALVADPKGGGRPVTRTWSFCPALLDGLSIDELADPTICLEDGATVPLGTGDTLPVPIPADYLDGPPAVASRDLPVLLEVRAGGSSHAAVKRVRVATTPAAGVAPTIGPIEISVGGDTVGAVEWGERAELDADLTGAFNSLYFYVSRGRISGYDWGVAGPQTWQLTGGSEPDHALVWAVTIDAGGTAWTSTDVPVE